MCIGKERHDIGRPGDAGYPIRGIITEKWLYLVNYESSRDPAGNPETGYLNYDASPTKTLLLGRKTDITVCRLANARPKNCTTSFPIQTALTILPEKDLQHPFVIR